MRLLLPSMVNGQGRVAQFFVAARPRHENELQSKPAETPGVSRPTERQLNSFFGRSAFRLLLAGIIGRIAAAPS